MPLRRSRIFVVVLLALVAFSTVFLQAPGLAKAQSSSIPLSQEYASGDIQVPYYAGGTLLLWYSWININGTHVMFLALHSNQADSPVFSFVGQAYNTSSGSRAFVGNALLAMEVYNDTNNNGYLDANYISGTTELRYTLIMNASQTFTPHPVNKTLINGTPHYGWGITYGSIQAILINATQPGYGYGGGMPASYAMIDHVSMFYDYSVSGNTTFLKTSYQIGNVTLIPPRSPGVTLQGLSLSLLHATLTVASKQLTVEAGNAPYNSQTKQPASSFNAAQVKVDDIVAYEFRFKDNYTLTNTLATYPAVYVASPIDSLPPGAFQGQYFAPLVSAEQYVGGQLPDIAGLPSSSNLDYSATQFLYRISYPVWSGQALQHDPTYVAHLGGTSTPNLTQGLPTGILAAAVVTGSLALLVAINGMRPARKTVEPVTGPQDPNEATGSHLGPEPNL